MLTLMGVLRTCTGNLNEPVVENQVFIIGLKGKLSAILPVVPEDK